MCALQHANSSFKTHHFYFLFSQTHMHISTLLLISMSSCLINSVEQPYQMHYWSPRGWHIQHFLEHRLSYQWHQDRLLRFISGKHMSTFILFSVYFNVFNVTVPLNMSKSLADDRGQTKSTVTTRLILHAPACLLCITDISFVICQLYSSTPRFDNTTR